MENCIYQGKTFCSYDLKDESGFYDEDMVLKLKQAAAERNLTCVDCNAPVYLAAGPIKEPYFAHYDLEACNYSSGNESEELKKGKRLLYHLLKRSFPEGEVFARCRMENGMFCTFFCRTKEDRPFVVDYRLLNNSLEKFQLRDNFYQANNIKPIYVMGVRQERPAKQIDWYQSLLQGSMGYLLFLDTQMESLIMKKSFTYRLGKERFFKYCTKVYRLKELQLDSSGQFLCDFSIECDRIATRITEEKLQYEKRKAQLRALKEEKERLQEIDQKRMEEYRNSSFDKVIYSDHSSLNPVILEKCRKMIEEGNAHLVSKKYYDAIVTDRI